MHYRLFKDARHFQILFQTIFLGYGLLYLHWNADWWLYATYFITSLGLQFICQWAFSKTRPAIFSRQYLDQFFFSVPSVLISSFGLSLLLKTNSPYIAAFAAAVSILSKFFIKIDGRHVFNPSALGIMVATLTGNAWISPGQWGSNMVILFTVITLGSIVVTRVQKLDVSIAFLGTFVLLLFVRQILYLGWPMDFFIQSLTTGSLLLFSFFMITDPKTTPVHWLARIIWSVIVAAVSFYLVSFKFISTAPVFVLVLAQPLVPILNKFFKAENFSWRRNLVVSHELH